MLVCALAFERRAVPVAPNGGGSWSDVVTDALGVPPLPSLASDGVLGDRVRLTANFRDQYYALVPAVADDAIGPPLSPAGSSIPGAAAGGAAGHVRPAAARPATRRPDRHCRRGCSGGPTGCSCRRCSIANQTRVIEAVADPAGAWLPGVPVLTARPTRAADVWPVAAVLTSPVASAWAWHRAAGTGLSADTLRLGPRWLARAAVAAGPVGPAVEALQAGDIVGCGREIVTAYGLDGTSSLVDWWSRQLPG